MSYINNTTATAMWAFKGARIVKDPGGKQESQADKTGGRETVPQTEFPSMLLAKRFTTSLGTELKIHARTTVLYLYFLVLYLIMQVNQIPHSINPIILKETFCCL